MIMQATVSSQPSSCPAVLTGKFKYADKMKATAAIHCQLFGEEELWSTWVTPMVPPTIIGDGGKPAVSELMNESLMISIDILHVVHRRSRLPFL